MSKKSYKRLQNRLYREIKRRIIAEQRIKQPLKFKTCDRIIDTLKICREIPSQMIQEGYDEYVRHLLVTDLAKKLNEDHYIRFTSRIDHPNDYIVVGALIDVVRQIDWDGVTRL